MTPGRVEQALWEALTSILMQYTQTRAMRPRPAVPKRRPAFRTAMGRVSMLTPMVPFSRCMTLSRLEMECSDSRFSCFEEINTVF